MTIIPQYSEEAKVNISFCFANKATFVLSVYYNNKSIMNAWVCGPFAGPDQFSCVMFRVYPKTSPDKVTG